MSLVWCWFWGTGTLKVLWSCFADDMCDLILPSFWLVFFSVGAELFWLIVPSYHMGGGLYNLCKYVPVPLVWNKNKK